MGYLSTAPYKVMLFCMTCSDSCTSDEPSPDLFCNRKFPPAKRRIMARMPPTMYSQVLLFFSGCAAMLSELLRGGRPVCESGCCGYWLLTGIGTGAPTYWGSAFWTESSIVLNTSSACRTLHSHWSGFCSALCAEERIVLKWRTTITTCSHIALCYFKHLAIPASSCHAADALSSGS